MTVEVLVFDGVLVRVTVAVDVLVGEAVKVDVEATHCMVTETVLLVTGPPPDQDAEP